MLANWWDRKKEKFLGLSYREISEENFKSLKIGKKNKKNKGTYKQQQPDSNIHDTYTHCPRV